MNTQARGIRVPTDVIEPIKKRAARRKMSFNQWINWAIKQGLRSHTKKEANDL